MPERNEDIVYLAAAYFGLDVMPHEVKEQTVTLTKTAASQVYCPLTLLS